MNHRALSRCAAPQSTRGARLRLFAAAALIASLAAPFAGPARSADAAAFNAAIVESQRANSGIESAVESAAERFGALASATPGDPVVLAYSGAATALRARTTMLPWKKMSFAEDGLAQIDKALALLNAAHDAPLYRDTPASLETRFTAASVFLALPGMFNRHARGAKLLDEVLASPMLSSAPLPFRGAVWLRAGVEASADKRTEDARRLLQQVLNSGAPQAEQAQAKLKELAS